MDKIRKPFRLAHEGLNVIGCDQLLYVDNIATEIINIDRGIMHLLDSVAKQEGLNLVFNLRTCPRITSEIDYRHQSDIKR